jgi:SRSO17 transposase
MRAMHGPREAIATISFVDQYCSTYQELFPEVRGFECFKFLHVGMISEIKRKSLPAIAKVVCLTNPQPLHHFLAESPWDIEAVRAVRLQLLLSALKEQEYQIVY